jgi:hypothetical protein
MNNFYSDKHIAFLSFDFLINRVVQQPRLAWTRLRKLQAHHDLVNGVAGLPELNVTYWLAKSLLP